MKFKQLKSPALLDQQQALSAYLDALLTEVSDGESTRVHGRSIEPSKVDPIERFPGENTVEPSISNELGDRQQIHFDVRTGVPDWAKTKVQYLQYTVINMKLATPMEKLAGVIEWDGTVTAVPGGASWMIGLIRNQDKNVQLVDTKQIINSTADLALDSAASGISGKYVVLIDEGRWGLLCDSVAGVLNLEPSAIRWRSERKRLRFIAGTITSELCFVLDPELLAEQLNTGRLVHFAP